jgi:hypothetical protein
MSQAFERRLHWCMRNGNLRVADLARWFARPHGTVRGWVKRSLNPGGSDLDVEHIHNLLDLLETMIKRKTGFPLPIGLSPRERETRVLQTREKVFESHL